MRKKILCYFIATGALVLTLTGCAKGKSLKGILPADFRETVGVVLFDKGALPDITGLYTHTGKNAIGGFRNMYHACIVKTDDKDYPYFMYFFGWAYDDCNTGWPACDAVFLARGKNLDEWEVYAKRLTNETYYWDVYDADHNYNIREWAPILCGGDVWYDSWHFGDPSVVYKDGKFYGVFSSYGLDMDMEVGGDNGDISCIIAGISDDGIHWTKSEYPIGIWEPEIGKREPVTSDGSDFRDTPFYGLYHRPCILWNEDGGKWQMWFDYIAPDPATGAYLFCMGYAENKGDFMKPGDWVFIQKDDSPAIWNFPNPEVIRIHGKYFAYGDPDVVRHGAKHERLTVNGWARRQLVEAQSDDGLNWTITGFVMPDEDKYANHVPCLYYEQGVLFLFYAGQNGYGDRNNPSPEYDFRYDNIRYMMRSIDRQHAEGKNFTSPYK